MLGDSNTPSTTNQPIKYRVAYVGERNSTNTGKLAFGNGASVGTMGAVPHGAGNIVGIGISTTIASTDDFTVSIDDINQSTDTPDGFGSSFHIDIQGAQASPSASHFMQLMTPLEGFDVQDFAGVSGSGDEVGLAAKKSGDLQNVNNIRGQFHMLLGVDIGKHGNADFVANRAKDAQAAFDTRPAPGFARGAVGFVETRLENVSDAKRGTGALE